MHRRSQDLLADVLGQAGRAWLLANDLERAYAAATAGLQSDPNNVALLIDRGEILATARSYWDALDDLNRALELSPNQLDALMFRAATYRLLDAAELAFEDIDRALIIAPDRPEAYIAKGDTYLLMKRPAQAKNAYQEAIRRQKNSFEAHLGMGQALYTMAVEDPTHTAGALAALQKAVDLRAGSARARVVTKTDQFRHFRHPGR